MTPAEAGWFARVALFQEWHQLIAAGYLTEDGLLAVRTRLDPTSNEFTEGPDLELLRLLVDEAIARARGIPVEEMPGRAPLPDTLEGWDD
jgi:hypothetical protein